MSQVEANGNILTMFIDFVYLKKDFELIYPQHPDFFLKSKKAPISLAGNDYSHLNHPRFEFFQESGQSNVKKKIFPTGKVLNVFCIQT